MRYSTKMLISVLGLTFSISASSSLVAQTETPFDGLYAPERGFESWRCTAEYLGGDGGAVGVVDGFLEGVESSCKLTKPTKVRGMDAVLYDAICSSEGEQYSYRVMLMRRDNGIYVVQNGYASEWRSCG